MNKPSLRERLRYMFDNSMSRGPIALIGWLALASALLVVVIAGIIAIAGVAPTGISPTGDPEAKASFLEVAWFSLMRTLDAGTMGGDTGRWPFLFAILAVTLGGVFIVSTLIGVLTSGIEGKVEELRKGRSRVIEEGHTLILGWSPRSSRSSPSWSSPTRTAASRASSCWATRTRSRWRTRSRTGFPTRRTPR